MKNIYKQLLLSSCVTLTITLTACSVEDPYETDPSQAQQQEEKKREEVTQSTPELRLIITDTSGQALGNAKVIVAGNTYQSSNEGIVTIGNLPSGNHVASVEKDGHFNHIQSFHLASTSSELAVKLAPKSSQQIKLIFAGDTMFGRRYMDDSISTMGNSVPNLPDAVIRPDNAAEASVELTKYVAELFKSADFASVNLETPVLNNPISVHPSKEFSFFSLPETLQGLTEIGVDYVALGNNHVYDYQQAGLVDTLKFVEQAGLLHSGAGNNTEEAFKSTYTNVNGTTLGLLSATSIRGTEHAVTYVAEADKGGAADISDNAAVTLAMADTLANSDYAIAQIHSGAEYSFAQTRYVNGRYEFLSRRKPDLMVTHHPHVAQGFAVYDGVPTLLGLGNFVFDQDRLETVLGLAVEVIVDKEASPKTVLAKAYPIYIDQYQPRLVNGDLSNYLMKRLAEFSDDNVTVIPRNGYAEVFFQATAPEQIKHEKQVKLDAGEHIVDLRALAPSNAFLSLIESTESQSVQLSLGRDILVFGDFEDWDNDEERYEVSHWDNNDEDITPCFTGALRGLQGMCMTRDQFDNFTLRMPFKQTVRAMPITPADDVFTVFKSHTLYGYAKGENAGPLSVDYTILTAEDSLVFSEHEADILPAGDYDWTAFHYDIELPSDDNVLGPENLPPRGIRFALTQGVPSSDTAELQLDEIAIISWQMDFQLTNKRWQTDKMHGKAFLKIKTDKAITLDLVFSEYK